MPADADDWEIMRQSETALRRRMLSGQWRADAHARMQECLGSTRSTAIAKVDISSNPYAQICNTLSVLYDAEPQVSHADPEAVAKMARLLSGASYSAVMQELQRLTLGLREMLLHVSAVPTGLDADPVVVCLRPVYPDLVVCKPDPADHASPISVTECRLSSDGWHWETADADPLTPVYSLRKASTEAGFSDLREGDQYPWHDSQGLPVLPYIMYHASLSHHLWDYQAWSEVVEGTLTVAVARSAYQHSLLMASFSQRWMVDADIASDLDEAANASVVADPSSILILRSTSERQPMLGQYQASFSPDIMQSAVSSDEARLAGNAGVPASDLLRTSGDPRSGYALALSREGRREAARKFESAFRRSDMKLMSTIARMVNSVLGTDYLPETGWSVSYRELPLTETEKTQRDDRIISQMQAGLISPAEARAALRGESLEDAKAAIREIRREAALRILEETE